MALYNLMNVLYLDVNNADGNVLIESHSVSLSNEYSIEHQELIKSAMNLRMKKLMKCSRLAIKNMNEYFMHLDKFLAIMEEYDPGGEHIYQICRTTEKDIAYSRTLY